RALSELGRTIVLTTHHLDEVDALADTVGVMAGGRIVATDTPRNLGGRSRGEAEVTFRWPEPLRAGELPLPATATLHADGQLVTVRTATPTDTVARLARWARRYGGELPELTVRRPTLEDVYLELVGGADAGPPDPGRARPRGAAAGRPVGPAAGAPPGPGPGARRAADVLPRPGRGGVQLRLPGADAHPARAGLPRPDQRHRRHPLPH